MAIDRGAGAVAARGDIIIVAWRHIGAIPAPMSAAIFPARLGCDRAAARGYPQCGL
jgi:hypothetical protein